MHTFSRTALMTIGEFAAATQLSPKALRLYDDERVLRPAQVDPVTGYRYYGREQIPTARLVRTLREMDVPLGTIAQIVVAPRAQADALLSRAAMEMDRRYARQRRAFQSGLALLHRMSSVDAPQVVSWSRAASTVMVREFAATATTLMQRLRVELAATRAVAEEARLTLQDAAFAVLVEPLSEEVTRVQLAHTVSVSIAPPGHLVLRAWPAVSCAMNATPFVAAGAPDIEAMLDALFDWLDRLGCHACEPPSIVLATSTMESGLQLAWPYQPRNTAGGNP